MGLWRVFYAGWQMECCGTPFSVGDEVGWQLLLVPGEEPASTITGPAEHVAGADQGIRVVRDAGLTVALSEDPRPAPAEPGPARRCGLLAVETHGSRWPEVTGRVRAIHLVVDDLAQGADGTWEPVPGTRTLHETDRCPKWFRDCEVRTDAGPRRRNEAGVLVGLDVPS
ncbi:hypothetical protein OQI_17725 [Streptomyces pharetrae CZA14]|uniref:Uncharacterized protein n=1 Tax=Streptomyces pharetrae CZA14 TaxID=1144883 RepID=A0ABX3YH47_9ACTN|nr:hypothetical protein OQI_17725 [Streptomyces pharetrae CZA14]